MNFADRLRSLRQDNALTQQDIAQVLDVSKSSINMYERGQREPNLELLEAIADYFNVDMDYLIGRSDIKNAYQYWKNENVNVKQTKDLKRILEVFDRLNGRGQHDLRLYAEFLYGKTEYQQARPSKPAIAAYGGEIKYKDNPKKGTD